MARRTLRELSDDLQRRLDFIGDRRMTGEELVEIGDATCELLDAIDRELDKAFARCEAVERLDRPN